MGGSIARPTDNFTGLLNQGNIMSLSKEIPNFHERLYKSLEKGGDKTALVYKDNNVSYTQLRNDVFSFAATISQLRSEPGLRLGIYARHSYFGSVAVLASILSNITNVPLNPEFADPRNGFIISHSELTHIFIDEDAAERAVSSVVTQLSPEKISSLSFLALADGVKATVKALDELRDTAVRSALSQSSEAAILHQAADSTAQATQSKSDESVLTAQIPDISERIDAMKSKLMVFEPRPLQADGMPETSWYPGEDFDTEAIMHFMFTSGSTGQSKSVAVTWDNYSIYFDQIMRRYQLRETDVFSSLSESTFDISLQDTACALVCGGTVVIPDKRDLMLIHKYVDDHRITVLHTGPHIISYLSTIHVLEKKKFESLRLTIFVGEALWMHHLKMFHNTFPNSILLNTYGPTECTVIFCYYDVPFSQLEKDDCPRSIVPLGRMFDSVQVYVADAQGNPVPDGTPGELIVGGNQITSGYYNSPERNAAAFFRKDGVNWYRTGDQVVAGTETITEDCLHGKAGETFTCYRYIGRNDDMMKVGTYRVSFYEVEEQLGKLTDRPVKVMRCTVRNGEFDEARVVAALEGATDEELASINEAMRSKLSKYMQPRHFFSIEEFPRNVNRKTDRLALKNMVIEKARNEYGIKLNP